MCRAVVSSNAMVEISFRGPVERRETIQRERFENGSDSGRVHVEAVERRTVNGTVEYPDGYVNLEGYSHDHMGMTLQETSIAHYVPDEYDIVDPDEWTIEILGTAEEWARQARQYVEERPDMSPEEALDLFAGWAETNVDPERVVERAL